ncbi:MAG: OmpA/MotB domain protein [Candidatus Solibacter sp.]|nr:OmpA/MotB domain protein [Candidatus Solibacter sp.]
MVEFSATAQRLQASSVVHLPRQSRREEEGHMIRTLLVGVAASCIIAAPLLSQQSVPLYRVTVVQRQVNAVNYQYRSGPTKVDFRGTVLMSQAGGEATVESKRGRTEITAKVHHVLAPGRFGREYLTYVLWAISPEGSPHNLGEIVPNSSDSATVSVTTDMQAFGMIVTAEPYGAVRQPSDVVILENEVRPDTVGRVQPITAKYELMPRGHYTWNVGQNPEPNTPKVSMREYEAITQVYQAQNAIGIARTANAAQLAPNTLSEAEAMLAEARRLQSIKADTSLISQSARAAVQTAEDARLIAERRAHEQDLTAARMTAAAAEQQKLEAQAEAQQAKAEANAARIQIDTEREARRQAEAAAAAAEQRAAAVQASARPSADRMAGPAPAPGREDAEQKSLLRMRLLEDLNGILPARDTPRGLLLTIPDQGFNGSALRSDYSQRLARVAVLLSTEPGLRMDVEGNTDSASSEAVALKRAYEVRDTLTRAGVSASSIQAQGLGATRLMTTTATESGRLANRRVEIVISGAPLGEKPFWDHTYSITRR